MHFLRHNVSAILLLSNSETYGRETASAEYFMQLADYLRIPVIAWNNAGLERVSNPQQGLSNSNVYFQLQKRYNILKDLTISPAWKSTVFGRFEFHPVRQPQHLFGDNVSKRKKERQKSWAGLHAENNMGTKKKKENEKKVVERTARSSLQLQLAPSLAHQAAAVLSVLQRYKWHQFSVVASQIAGHDEFIQAVRDAVHRVQGTFKLVLLQALVVSPHEPDLGPLVSSETRIVLLYCTREEAKAILAAAAKLRLNGTDYLWLATQSVIGSAMEAPDEFPVGMLGIHFPTDSDELLQQLSRALRVFATALEQFVRDAALPAPGAAPAALARPPPPAAAQPVLRGRRGRDALGRRGALLPVRCMRCR
ncbi:Glutamate receptor ionotropic, NMDA 2B [Frankliniella fusca]|uniref:Glutamate receptor ionotropic, NMDA 2B n=1 Tax=Frankliniella fusca TaxID=407009 RepID=A0AAE1LEI5_9NEOP|nr:Glutamate receptor ionotropic, NMDA 2B [Frankliniella fusca]